MTDRPRFNSVEEADAWAERHRTLRDAPPPGNWYPNTEGEPAHAVPAWDFIGSRWNHHVCGNCNRWIDMYGVDENDMQRYTHTPSADFAIAAQGEMCESPRADSCERCGYPLSADDVSQGLTWCMACRWFG